MKYISIARKSFHRHSFIIIYIYEIFFSCYFIVVQYKKKHTNSIQSINNKHILLKKERIKKKLRYF